MIPVLRTGCPPYAFFSLTSCTDEKCIFQLTQSRAFQQLVGCGSAPKKSGTSHRFTLRQLKREDGLFPPLRISLAGRNVLKNLPRKIFSACVKFGGNPCRDVDTLGFYTHTHTHTHTYTNEIIY